MSNAALVRVQDAPAAVVASDPMNAPPSDHLDFDALVRLAEMVVPTGLLPNHVKTPGQFLAIALAGRELGMPIMRSLRSLMLVQGKVQEGADSQLSRFKLQGGHAKWLVLNDREAKLWLRHPNGDEWTQSFTWEDAERADLAGKAIWQKHPEAMLRSRCITAGLKSLGWEGGVGIYDPDEVAEFAPPPAEQPAPQRAAPKKATAATDEQRTTLKALSENVHIFTPEQCDGLADKAADAGLTEAEAADLIRRAQNMMAKYTAAHPEPAPAAPEGNAAAPAATAPTSTGASTTTATNASPASGATSPKESTTTPATTRSAASTATNAVRRPDDNADVEQWRAYAKRLLDHPANAQLVPSMAGEIDAMPIHQLQNEAKTLEAIVSGWNAKHKKQEQGRAGQAARKANDAAREAKPQPALTDAERGFLDDGLDAMGDPI